MLILIPTAYEAGLLLGEGKANELRNGNLVAWEIGGRKALTGICGFGLAAAGAGTAYWLGKLNGRRNHEIPLENGLTMQGPDVVIAGLAGTYDEARMPIGGAMLATATHCWGIGACEGENFISAEDLGWQQGHPLSGVRMVGDRIALAAPPLEMLEGVPRGEILSVTSASASIAEAAKRAAGQPATVAEEMEAYAAALAARLMGARLAVVRGICNRAGDRNKDNWCAEEAMAAVREVLGKFAGANFEPENKKEQGKEKK